jgi:hypothetical protein
MADDHAEPRELLAKAIQQLDEEDRVRVTSWLLGRTFGDPPRRGVAGAALLRDTRDRLLTPVSEGMPRGDYQVVPFRLPAEQHAALRDWCAAHNFTMATVVRGLVERFLAEQGQAA